MSPNMVSIDVKRELDGSFKLSPEELEIILDAEDEEDVPLRLREAYKTVPPPLPKAVGRVRFGGTLYLLPNRQKKFYLRLEALRKFAGDSLEAFYDTAGQGGYGDVQEGDWEAAGIKPEDSVAVAASNELLDPLEEVWKQIQNEWTEQGVNLSEADYVIDESEDASEYEARFDEKYQDHIQDYFSRVEIERKKEFETMLETKLDEFVDDMRTI